MYMLRPREPGSHAVERPRGQRQGLTHQRVEAVLRLGQRRLVGVEGGCRVLAGFLPPGCAFCLAVRIFEGAQIAVSAVDLMAEQEQGVIGVHRLPGARLPEARGDALNVALPLKRRRLYVLDYEQRRVPVRRQQRNNPLFQLPQLGVSLGHAEVLAFAERWLSRLRESEHSRRATRAP